MDIDSFIIYIKTDELGRHFRQRYKDISEGVETRFHTSNYELDRLLPKGKKLTSN